MAALDVAVLLGLALGSLVFPLQTFRINHEIGDTSSEELRTMTSVNHKCCMIIEGNLYGTRRKAPVSLQNEKCRQTLRRNKLEGIRTRSSGGARSIDLKKQDPCKTGKYPHPSNVDILKVETLENNECYNVPMCSMVTLSKCYRITDGELSPWGYDNVSLPQQDFPSGMAISIAGNICQRSEDIRCPRTYTHHFQSCRSGHVNLSHKCPYNSSAHGARFAKLEIKAVQALGNQECEGGKWKHHGWEAAPECDDFGFWKQVLSTEGIKAPNWEASIAAAKDSSPEGMAWGTTMSVEAHQDTLWNARRDTVLAVDDFLSSWS